MRYVNITGIMLLLLLSVASPWSGASQKDEKQPEFKDVNGRPHTPLAQADKKATVPMVFGTPFAPA